MEDVHFKLEANQKGKFYIEQNDIIGAEMVVGITDNKLTIYHTDVLKELEGHGLSRKLFEEMIIYARQHQLKVIPTCTFAAGYFNKHADMYNDVLDKN